MEAVSGFAELMQRVQAGDTDAARLLHAEYGPHLRRAVRKRLHQKMRSRFDSLDFAQDVWMSFFADAPQRYQFETPEQLVAFLTRMARNKVAAATRNRLIRKKQNINRECRMEDPAVPKTRLFAPTPTPSEIVGGREEWDQFLDRQPLVHRRIFLLLQKGHSSATIAAELGLSQRTINRVIRKVSPLPPGAAAGWMET
ncbi:MAG: sigma-70 family RNA polymerase sigma factor [Gemmataceae bacterium]|nr:sigma-70 family RNA polymerase sigma factor [Gemmataceae bacterium]MCI0737525.1 sigma-70 family RNA polymerase sigma factor [Gemmataceae bacterium]